MWSHLAFLNPSKILPTAFREFSLWPRMHAGQSESQPLKWNFEYLHYYWLDFLYQLKNSCGLVRSLIPRHYFIWEWLRRACIKAKRIIHTFGGPCTQTVHVLFFWVMAWKFGISLRQLSFEKPSFIRTTYAVGTCWWCDLVVQQGIHKTFVVVICISLTKGFFTLGILGWKHTCNNAQ